MKIRIDFTKASGAGNDFIIVDDREGKLWLDKSELTRTLCSRHEGVGGDGLLVIGRSQTADFSMEYYNADGSTGAMCGNGGRCVARYAFVNGIAESTVRFEVLGSVYEAEGSGENVVLKMKDPSDIKTLPLLCVQRVRYSGFFVDTGAPHAVFFTDQLADLDVEGIGRSIRNSPELGPTGANVDFVHLHGDKSLSLRTYERGVERETLACGTGAVASALVSNVQRRAEPPVRVCVQSGDILMVHFKSVEGRYIDILLEGRASLTFSGSVMYDLSSFKISTPYRSA